MEALEEIIDGQVDTVATYTRKLNTYREAYLKCSMVQSLTHEIIERIWSQATDVE